MGGGSYPHPLREGLSLLIIPTTVKSFLKLLDDEVMWAWGVEDGGVFLGFFPLSLFCHPEVMLVSSIISSIGVGVSHSFYGPTWLSFHPSTIIVNKFPYLTMMMFLEKIPVVPNPWTPPTLLKLKGFSDLKIPLRKMDFLQSLLP